MPLAKLSLLDSVLGAQILSAQSKGWPSWLYDSPLPAAAGQAVRGGVPVLFPQFANRGPLPKHGFARNRQWQMLRRWQEPEQCGVLYQLNLTHGAEPAWPHSATLELEAQLTHSALRMALRVTNTGKQPMPWTGGLHPYWRVPQLQDARLLGLALAPQGLHFDAQGLEQLHPNRGPLVLSMGQRAMQLQATGFSEWMVWNPGQAGALQLADLPPDDWQHFVCIEPVCVCQPVELLPGEVFEGTLLSQWLPN